MCTYGKWWTYILFPTRDLPIHVCNVPSDTLHMDIILLSTYFTIPTCQSVAQSVSPTHLLLEVTLSSEAGNLSKRSPTHATKLKQKLKIHVHTLLTEGNNGGYFEFRKSSSSTCCQSLPFPSIPCTFKSIHILPYHHAMFSTKHCVYV